MYHLFFFFFSSRRRHTRFSRDWSSDVCSSDLVGQTGSVGVGGGLVGVAGGTGMGVGVGEIGAVVGVLVVGASVGATVGAGVRATAVGPVASVGFAAGEATGAGDPAADRIGTTTAADCGTARNSAATPSTSRISPSAESARHQTTRADHAPSHPRPRLVASVSRCLPAIRWLRQSHRPTYADLERDELAIARATHQCGRGVS